jgi:tight adherence protein B
MNSFALMMLFAALGMTGLGITAFLVVTGHAHYDRVRQRFQAATEPHLRVRRIEPPRLFRAKVPERENSPLDRISQLFGFQTSRLEQYPVKWYLVVLAMLVAARLVGGVIVSIAGPIGWASLPVIWVMGSRFAFGMMMLRRRQALYNQFPDCLSMIVRSVRAGVPLTEAIRIVSRESPVPSSDEFSRVAGDLSVGVPISDALRALADRNEITEFRFFSTALTLQSQTGGRLGETLDNLGGIIRKRMALKSRGRALASEARTTALILGCLPLLAGGALYLMNPNYIMVLFTDPTGKIILATAAVMLCMGALVMRAIIEKALA